MSSIIAPMQKAKCKNCGEMIFSPKVMDSTLKISVYYCDKCHGEPDQIRLRRFLPIGIDGKSERVDILFNRMGQRITDIHEALHIARSLDYDLKDGRFDPSAYVSASKTNQYLFRNLIEKKYVPFCENKYGHGKYKDKQVSINHLLRFFGNMDTRKIEGPTIEEYNLTYKCGERSKHKSIQELGFILKQFKRMGYVAKVPDLPETSQSRGRDIGEFLTKEEQQIILSYIENEYYHDMIEILCIYALRPGDLRALKWNDLDFKNEEFKIDEHFAKSSLLPGRKSSKEVLVLPMTDRFKEIVGKIPPSINTNDFVFMAKDSRGRTTKGAVGERRLAHYWNKASEKAARKHKIKLVTMYVGTKSSSLTSYVNDDGISLEDLQKMTGHSSTKVLKRYAKESNKTKIKTIKNILSKSEKKA